MELGRPLISVVSPVYMGGKMVEELVSRISSSVASITADYEIILVNDCSPDNSWEQIKKVCSEDVRVKGLNLSRNFGQHYAITAGLAYSRGEWVVVMDCDLQDRPEEISGLYTKAMEGWDTVLAQRVSRKDTAKKKLSSRLFYRVFSYLTDTEQDASVANFGIYHRKVIDAILSMGDSMRYFPAQVKWVGFRRTCMPVEHSERAEGHSSYNIKKLIRLAMDTIISFSDKPMRLTVKLGMVVTVLSVIAGIYCLVMWLCGQIEVIGWTSIMISLWLISGILVILLGITGLYVGKMFEKVKGRPLYIVKEACNYKTGAE